MGESLKCDTETQKEQMLLEIGAHRLAQQSYPKSLFCEKRIICQLQ